MKRVLFAAALLAGSAGAAAQPPPAPADCAVGEVQGESLGRMTLHRALVEAPPEAVWQAVATAEGWRTWAAPFSEMAPGSDLLETSYDLDGAPGRPGNIVSRFTSLDAPHSLTFATVKAPAGSFLDRSIATLSQVTWRIDLVAQGEGRTCVRLTGSGYAPGPEGDAILDFFLAGNSASLGQLQARFATGPVDWEALLAGAG